MSQTNQRDGAQQGPFSCNLVKEDHGFHLPTMQPQYI